MEILSNRMMARERTPRVPQSFCSEDLLAVSNRGGGSRNSRFSANNTYQLVRPKTQLKGTGIRTDLAEKRKIVEGIVGKHERSRLNNSALESYTNNKNDMPDTKHKNFKAMINGAGYKNLHKQASTSNNMPLQAPESPFKSLKYY